MQTGTGPAGRAGVAQTIDELDLGALGRAIWRRKRLIIGLTLLAAAIAFAAVNYVAPRYKSEARVLIETRENIFLRPEADRSTERSATVDQEAVTSQVQLILSRGLALDVIRKLKLGEKPEFDPVLRGPSAIRTMLGIVGLVKDPMSQTPEERVLKSYMDRLVAFQVDKSRVIAIEFESQDPELAAQVVNTIADGFVGLQQTARQEQAREAAVVLLKEIEKLRQSVADAESKVELYRATTNLMIGTNNTTLSSQQLGDVNAQVASARAQKSDAESKARIIREALKRGAATEVSDVMNSEILRRLSEQQVTLRAQLAEQSSTLLDQHPRIKELRAQIADLSRQIRSEAERLAISFENDAKGAADRLQSLSAMLDQLKKQAGSSNEQDVKLRALEREAKSQRDLLESVSRQVSRGDRARQHRRLVAGGADHFARDRLQYAVVAEENTDRADRIARHVHPGGRLHPDRTVDERAAADAGIRIRAGRANIRAGRAGCGTARCGVCPDNARAVDAGGRPAACG